ncbi:MAG: 1-acyl-sn-glycerol-3-phosphate acyltransferase [Bacteriovoracaceae bacterium]|jgi:1-acyl-sn-glycerol-3-phosphate acyltransferase|nr:1-acyl-sn-glycerol-3-phosphate acyltransferase [Bacteriovoracaceae bacterium]
MIKYICHKIAKAQGWKVNNHIPKNLKKAVIIGAPHTSNWDFVTVMHILYSSKIEGKFLIKNEWLSFPLGSILKSIGAIGVDRKKLKNKESITKQLTSLLINSDELLLLISPEGTRSKNEKWKSGFYYIAKEAGVPIILAKANYKSKEAEIGKVIITPQSYNKDMELINEYYKDVIAKNPENFGLNNLSF